MIEQLGPVRGNLKIGPVTIFPNLSFLASEVHRTVRIWHPRGPDKTEVWSWCFVDKDAPPEVKNAHRLGTLRAQSGPGGTWEQDDGENWKECTLTSMGNMAKKLEFNYQIGLDREHASEDYPGSLGPAPSETNQRGLYRRWADMMAAESWAGLKSGSEE